MRIFILIFLTLILSACGKNGRRKIGAPCDVPVVTQPCAIEPVVCAEPHYDPKPKKVGCKKKKKRCCPCPKRKVRRKKCD